MKPPKVALRPACERRDERYMLAGACIEWTDPGGGTRTLQVLDISRRGLNFGLEPGAVQLPEGLELTDVVLNLGEAKIRGRLIVTQAVDSTSRGATCGGEFHPASFDDAENYRAIVVALESSAAFKTTMS